MAVETIVSGEPRLPTSSTTPAKTHTARLLDMVVGWAEYVEATEDEFPDTLTSAKLYGLYQDAAHLMLIGDSAVKRNAVATFLNERVVPLILREG